MALLLACLGFLSADYWFVLPFSDVTKAVGSSMHLKDKVLHTETYALLEYSDLSKQAANWFHIRINDIDNLSQSPKKCYRGDMRQYSVGMGYFAKHTAHQRYCVYIYYDYKDHYDLSSHLQPVYFGYIEHTANPGIEYHVQKW